MPRSRDNTSSVFVWCACVAPAVVYISRLRLVVVIGCIWLGQLQLLQKFAFAGEAAVRLSHCILKR